MSAEKPKVIFVLGGPGAGKGTQCANIVKAMIESSKNKFLIDGFPRSKDNMEGWERQMGSKVNLRCVFFFDCTDQICVDRCLKRGLAGSGRTDDNEESLRKRLLTYQRETMPIIMHYESLGLVRKIDAAKPEEEVFEEIKVIFKEFDAE
ncbi:hypothetical protein QYM36_017114 [Artemia franciscana]|uniref:Nucleoside-diphosphate kinase n=1 Tax=Artemia franciscana TaxID=6661 RepID=A0AA88KWL6_ARTSF|nr:hypothetical protein QYM36_017114 [Artemia franciscana]